MCIVKNTNIFADKKLAVINSVVQWKPKEPSEAGVLPVKRPGPNSLPVSISGASLRVEDGPPLAGFTPTRPGYLFAGPNSIPSLYSISDITIKLCLTEVTTKFSGLYLLNHLVFERFVESGNPRFSYSVEISKDDTTFNTLINYSQYYCHGRQELFFPVQAIQ